MKNLRKSMLGLIALCIIVFLSQTSVAQNKFEKWKIDFDKEVEWIKITDSGILLVAAKGEGLYGIDPSSGETLWEFQEVKNLPEDLVEVITNSNYIIVYGRGFKSGQAYCLDASTGELKFNTMDKFQMSLTGGVTPIYQTESLLLVAGDRFVNVKPETGEVLWDVNGFVSGGDKRILGPQTFGLRSDKKMSIQSIKGNQPFLFDSKETFIAHLAKGHLAKYNVNTGERIWGFDFKENKIKLKDDVQTSAPNLGFAQMQIDFDRKRVYLPVGDKLMAVNTETGALVWFSEKKSLPGKVVDMVWTDEGI